MELALNEITDKALSLPIDDRVTLAKRLWDSIEGFIDPETEDAWLYEAEKRWQEIEEGRVECIPAEEAMKKAKASLSIKKRQPMAKENLAIGNQGIWIS